jgi:hypothetical protein
MLALVTGHVDERGRLPRHPDCRFADCIGGTDKGIDRPVRVGARIDVEKRDAVHTADRGGDGVNRVAITTLGNIRDALDEPRHSPRLYRPRTDIRGPSESDVDIRAPPSLVPPHAAAVPQRARRGGHGTRRSWQRGIRSRTPPICDAAAPRPSQAHRPGAGRQTSAFSLAASQLMAPVTRSAQCPRWIDARGPQRSQQRAMAVAT